MLAKRARLTKKNDFDRAFKFGRSSYEEKLGIKYIKNELNINRYGIIVSSKTAKLAPERNLLKRRIRAIIQNNEKKIKQGFDVVIITMPGITKLKYPELKNLIEKVLRRTNLLLDEYY